MFGHARRWRGVATLGLMLATVQAPAWGGETLWKQAADVVCRFLQGPHALPPLPAEAQDTDRWFVGGFRLSAATRHHTGDEQSTALFTWEQQAAPFVRSDLLNIGGKQSSRAVLEHQPICPGGFIDESDSPAPILPERKDILPDTERTQVLVDMSMIASQNELLAKTPPVSLSSGWLGVGYMH